MSVGIDKPCLVNPRRVFAGSCFLPDSCLGIGIGKRPEFSEKAVALVFMRLGGLFGHGVFGQSIPGSIRKKYLYFSLLSWDWLADPADSFLVFEDFEEVFALVFSHARDR